MPAGLLAILQSIPPPARLARNVAVCSDRSPQNRPRILGIVESNWELAVKPGKLMAAMNRLKNKENISSPRVTCLVESRAGHRTTEPKVEGSNPSGCTAKRPGFSVLLRVADAGVAGPHQFPKHPPPNDPPFVPVRRGMLRSEGLPLPIDVGLTAFAQRITSRRGCGHPTKFRFGNRRRVEVAADSMI